MKTTYLYGDFSDLDKQILLSSLSSYELKISKAKQLLDSLIEEPIKTRDWKRINSVQESIKFNTDLITEIKVICQ